jgi:hypothetical protein
MNIFRDTTRTLARFDELPRFALRSVIGWLMILHALYKFHVGLASFQKYMLDPTGDRR